ncbi:MAG: hypothetical protein ACLPM8_05840 [Myxococcaceae bacterium]
MQGSRGSLHVARRWAWLFLATLALLLLPTSAEAYPFMIRHDYTGCGVCHVDPSGAGLLTDYGRAQDVLLLQMNYGAPFKGDEAPSYANFAFGVVPLPDWLLAQVTFRGAEFWVAETTAATPTEAAITASNQQFLMMLLDARAELKLGIFRAAGSLGWGTSSYTDLAVLVTNRGDNEQLLARDYWVGLQLDDSLLIRLGRINLPFGLRNVEHTAWVRNNTQTDINVDQQSGLSVAFDNGKVRTEVLAILGNLNISPDAYRQRGFSGLVEVPVAERASVGFSALVTRAELSLSAPSPTLRQVYGAFSRWAPIEPVVVMVEADVYLNSTLGSGVVQPNGTSWLQVDWEPIQGLHFAPAIETLTSYGVNGTGVGTWMTIDWFCLPHTDIRLDGLYRYQPTATSSTNTFSFLIQLHTYL